ncbi:MAG: PLD nuclease N-terminal domain-containing protein [Nanoarchaeota archaeon]
MATSQIIGQQAFLFPFIVIMIAIIAILAILLFVFWIWMLVDCAKRDFKKENEKIVWILVIALVHWLGAAVYYFVVKNSNPKGISK